MPRSLFRLKFGLYLSCAACAALAPTHSRVWAQSATAPTSVLAPDALFATPVFGLERTGGQSEIVAATRQPFARALRVTIKTDSTETNATQLTLPNSAAIAQGDALLATLWVRGTASAKVPAQIQFLFEKSSAPWTKSVTFDIGTSANAAQWKRVVIPFASAADFAPGEAMASFRLAFGPQTIEIGGLSLVSYGKTRTAAQLVEIAAAQNPLGRVTVAIDLTRGAQKLGGFGGNFAQPRYGATAPMDAVGEFNFKNLNVTQARIGIPLEVWAPERGVFKDEGAAHAALLQLQMMAKRKIPLIGSVWEGPAWMVGGAPETGGKILPRERYADCIEAVAQFLVMARDKYGAPVDYFSFNEADLGVNFKFSSAQMIEFIALAGPRFRELGLKTQFLVGDTANGSSCAEYSRPLLENQAIAPFLGPIAFHSWDALGASESKYREIAALGKQYGKEIWCTEAGHDAQLWQQKDPWPSWDNALRLALAYERTMRLSGAQVMDYWTYQDNYRLVSPDGKTPYPAWIVLRDMERALAKGHRVVASNSSNADLKVIAARGPKAGQWAVVLINPAGAGEITLRGLPKNAIYSSFSNEKTGDGFVNKPQYADTQGNLRFHMSSRSMLTILSGSVSAS